MLSLDQLKVFFTTTLIEGFYFGNDAFSWISEVQYDCLKRQRDYASFKDGSSSLCQFD